jgi:hypothetical protein
VALGNGTSGDFAGSLKLTKLNPDFTNTATVGNVTINKAAGQVIMGAAANTLTLTNSLITANSQIQLTFAANPGVAVPLFAVAAAGSATINTTANVVNQCAINFNVTN